MAQYASPSHNNTIFNNSDFGSTSSTPTLASNNTFTGVLNSFPKISAANITIGKATVTSQLNLPSTVSGTAGSTIDMLNTISSIGPTTLNIGAQNYNGDCKNVNINAGGQTGFVNIGNNGSNLGPAISILSQNNPIKIYGGGTSYVNIGQNVAAANCPVNINTLTNTTTGVTNIGSSAYFQSLTTYVGNITNIMGSCYIGNNTPDTLTIRASTTFLQSITANSQVVSTTSLGYLSGVTSNIQTQFTNIFTGINNWTGANTFITQATTDNSTLAATTAFVNTALMGGVDDKY